MKFRVIAAGLVCTTLAVTAQAQCPATAADACQKAVDLLTYLTPQLSTALASGNPTLGQGGALGGFGHFSIDIRASAVNGSLPNFNSAPINPGPAVSNNFHVKNQLIPAASVDAAIGLWRGIPLGITHVGGIDGIVTMTYLPNISDKKVSACSGGGCGSNTGNISVDGSSEKFGYGVRLGLLEESVATPGVSVAWVKRDLPTISYSGTVDSVSALNPGGTFSLGNFAVKTTAWRITAAKSFNFVGLSLGYGQDKYDANSSITAHVNGPLGGTGTEAGDFSMTRTNYFVGAFVNLFIFKLEGEYGQVTGGTATTINTFDSKPANASRSYFTLGLRFGN